MTGGCEGRHRLAALVIGRWVGRVSLLLAIAGVVVACTSTATSSPSSPGASASAASFPTSPVVGVVTHVDATGLASVKGFTLRTAGGTVLDFAIGTLENGAEFPPGHLVEHQATADPVRVSFRVEGSVLVAYRIEDATSAPSST